MKINFQIFFLFLLISYITTCGPSSGNPKSADDCKDDTISAGNKQLDFTHCCYVDIGIESQNKCIELTSYQYKNFGKLLKKVKKEGSTSFGVEAYEYDIKVDCGSYYFQIYLLSLITLLILF